MVQRKDLRRFKVAGGTITVYHNLPAINGISIEDAFIGWQNKAKIFTSLSFVNYIDSINEPLKTGYEAFTEEQYNKLTP